MGKKLGVLVKKEHVKKAIDHLMNGGEEAAELRRGSEEANG